MRRFLRSPSSPQWCRSLPASVLGWGFSCLHSCLEISLAAPAGGLYLCPCIVQKVLHGSFSVQITDSLNINNALVDSPRWHDDDVVALESNPCWRILLPDCHD
jgi:hypothetical protein